MEIRSEIPADAIGISALIDAAFAVAEHSDGTEAAIVERLRAAGAMTLSLVADEAGEIVGHAAFSQVSIDGQSGGWFGLGPVAVAPGRQGGGIGEDLIREGLDRLRAAGAAGCVVLGDPAYYGRFGFMAHAGLRYPGPPAEYFQALAFCECVPTGEIAYHPAFTGP